MTFFINKNKKILVGRNNQPTTVSLNLDFHTKGYIEFTFIDDQNKIEKIDPHQKYYFAGKLKDVLFLSKTFTLTSSTITFEVDTYTEPFLAEITKRNTEIEIELGIYDETFQKVLLRDYAFAQPRVYIEGLNPAKVDLNDYYTREEVDSLLAELDFTETDPVYTTDKPFIALKSELFSGSYTDLTDKPEIFEPTTNGDGKKFLADNGQYEEIETGGIQNLKNYEEKDANGNYDNININGNYININANGNINLNGAATYLPYATYWDGQDLSRLFNYNQEWYGGNTQNIYITNNNGGYITYVDPINYLDIYFNSINKSTNGEIHVFQTAGEFSLSLNYYNDAIEQMLFNKTPDFQPNKKYFVFCNGYVFIWKEIINGILV